MKYVVSNGKFECLGFDSASGGYPYITGGIYGAHIYSDPQLAQKDLDDKSVRHYVNLTDFKVYKLKLEEWTK